MRFQLFEPEGRVLESPGKSLRFIKKTFQSQRKMIWATAPLASTQQDG
jgi:hypothetical protein